MPKPPKIIDVNYGLASAYSLDEGDLIEMNHKLVGDLREKIRKHELRHKPDRKYTKEDFVNDFQSENSYFLESLKFGIMNPEALVNFMPFMYSYYLKKLTFNTPALVPFGYFGLIFSLVTSIFIKFVLNGSFLKTFLLSIVGYSIVFIILNALLMLLAHYIVRKDKDFKYAEVLE